MLVVTDRDDRRTWSVNEYRSSTGNLRDSSKIRIDESNARFQTSSSRCDTIFGFITLSGSAAELNAPPPHLPTSPPPHPRVRHMRATQDQCAAWAARASALPSHAPPAPASARS